MSGVHKDREQVWAILRWDGFYSADRPPEVRVTVKEIIRTAAVADAEVARLNSAVEGEDVRYWAQVTRLFPEGKAAGPDVGR